MLYFVVEHLRHAMKSGETKHQGVNRGEGCFQELSWLINETIFESIHSDLRLAINVQSFVNKELP